MNNEIKHIKIFWEWIRVILHVSYNINKIQILHFITSYQKWKQWALFYCIYHVLLFWLCCKYHEVYPLACVVSHPLPSFYQTSAKLSFHESLQYYSPYYMLLSAHSWSETIIPSSRGDHLKVTLFSLGTDLVISNHCL